MRSSSRTTRWLPRISTTWPWAIGTPPSVAGRERRSGPTAAPRSRSQSTRIGRATCSSSPSRSAADATSPSRSAAWADPVDLEVTPPPQPAGAHRPPGAPPTPISSSTCGSSASGRTAGPRPEVEREIADRFFRARVRTPPRQLPDGPAAPDTIAGAGPGPRAEIAELEAAGRDGDAREVRTHSPGACCSTAAGGL
jgi:hypothetical protein